MLSRINVHTPRHIYTKYNYMHKCIITVFKFTQWQYELLILTDNSFFIKMQKEFLTIVHKHRNFCRLINKHIENANKVCLLLRC